MDLCISFVLAFKIFAIRPIWGTAEVVAVTIQMTILLLFVAFKFFILYSHIAIYPQQIEKVNQERNQELDRIIQK